MHAPNHKLEGDVELAETMAKDPTTTASSKPNSQEAKLSEMRAYYHKMSTASIPALLSEVKTTIAGISEEERALRLQVNGFNVVTDDNTPTWYFMLFKALTHPFNILLITLSIITISTGDPIGFTVLIVMVLLSVTVRFTQEMNAIISAEALKKKITQKVSVRRPPMGESDGVEEEERGKGYSSKMLMTHEADEEDPDNPGDGTDCASSVAGSHTIEQLSHENIVVGDIVVLHTGCVIPADLRIIESNHLSVNQRMLTGESIPVEKFVEVSSTSLNADFLRKENLCFLGTTVEFGSGIGVVIRTGQKTFFGLNSEMLTVARPPSAFDVGVKKVSYLLIGISMVMVAVVITVAGFSSGDWLQAGLFGVAVAVGLTPEMLPMVVNSVLSVGASQMARKKCIVKRLESIQNFGSMTCLCTDKTGTLTEDCIQLYSHIDCLGQSDVLPLKIGYAIASSQTSIRSPIDQAIIASGEGGSDVIEEDRRQLTDALQAFLLKASKVSEIPFDFNRKRMSVVMDLTSETGRTKKQPHHTASSDVFLFCKGAFDQTIACCTSVATSSQSIDGADVSSLTMKPLDESELGKITALFHSLSSLGLRVVCVAAKRLSEEDVVRAAANQLSFDDEKDLCVIGFLTFLDKPKADAQETLEAIKGLHVNVKVLTGDNPLIAAQVCHEIGLDSTKILTGDDIYHLSWDCNDVDLQELFQRTVVFAHLSPNDKAFIIRTLRAADEVVGFLGDGVNDALAMHEADIGICVDSGADIAKDAADVILTEKSLTILKNAIVVGRAVYGNTIKYIKMAASSNFGNCFSLLFAAGFLPFLPIQPVQLLIQNLLYDISQIAIPFDKMDADYLRQPKKWDMSTLFSFIVCVGPISSIFDILIFMLGFYYFGWDNEDQQSRFQTIWFIEGLLSQTLIVHMIRTEKIPFLQSIADWRLLLASFTVSVIGVVIPNIPRLNDALQMTSPPGVYYGFLVVILVAYMLLLQTAKKLYMTHFQSWL